jgi:hypothetical protein
MRSERPIVDEDAAERFRKVRPAIDRFMPFVERNCSPASGNSPAMMTSWSLLRIHAELCWQFAAVLEAKARSNEARADELLVQMIELVQKQEPDIQRVFDVSTFVFSLKHRMFKKVF